jgi:hypothetical protein
VFRAVAPARLASLFAVTPVTQTQQRPAEPRTEDR